MTWHRIAVVSAIALTLFIIIIALVGCGQNVTTENQFRQDCEKAGGTYTAVQNDSPMCTYDKK